MITTLVTIAICITGFSIGIYIAQIRKSLKNSIDEYDKYYLRSIDTVLPMPTLQTEEVLTSSDCTFESSNIEIATKDIKMVLAIHINQVDTIIPMIKEFTGDEQWVFEYEGEYMKIYGLTISYESEYIK